MKSKPLATIVIPCGPGKESILDTADSIEHHCPEPHNVVFVDDCTTDGTYEALLAAKRPNWHILRNDRPNGFLRLAHSLCSGLKYIHTNLSGRCVLKLDVDSLLIRNGVITDAIKYIEANPNVGLFGVYEVDYNKPRDFSAHKNQMDNALRCWRRILGLRPSWVNILYRAESNGYHRGENVSGGGYFMTWSCLDAIRQMGYLEPPLSWYNPVTEFCFRAIEKIRGRALPYSWHGRLAEDVYFSMVTVAAGYKLGHFAAPDGPICVALRGLPYPAEELLNRGYKIVHGVDKGPNTSAFENEGITARELFRQIRKSGRKYDRSWPNQ